MESWNSKTSQTSQSWSYPSEPSAHQVFKESWSGKPTLSESQFSNPVADEDSKYDDHGESSRNSLLKTSANIQLTITGPFQGAIIMPCLSPNDSIEGIKKSIWEKTGIFLEQQCLMFEDTILMDKLTLGAYKIFSGSTLKLYSTVKDDDLLSNDEKPIAFNLLVKYQQEYTLPVVPFCTVNSLREAISTLLSLKFEDVILISKRRPLLKEDKQISEYEITKEIKVISPAEPKILVWVDDMPQTNLTYILETEGKDITFILCTSTVEAVELIESYKWLLSRDKDSLRIVTDMVRIEDNGVKNFYAGIDILKKLYHNYKYNHETFIFCNDEALAKKSCKEKGLKGPYNISNSVGKLRDFLSFKK